MKNWKFDSIDSETEEGLQRCSEQNQLKKDGPVTNIQIVGYWNYVFTISFQTPNYFVTLKCGGNPKNLDMFDPFNGWAEWEYAEIISFSYKPKTLEPIKLAKVFLE